MFWSLCLCGYLLFCRSFLASGFQVYTNTDGRAVSVAGDDASLTCYYGPGVSRAEAFGGIFWKFSPKSDPTTNIDITSYEVSNGIRYSNGLSSKLKLNASWQYGGSLKIMNSSLDDQGEYTCQISTDMGFEQKVITLTVYAVPRFLRISNSTHQRADPSSTFVTASGEALTLVCSSFPPSNPATNLSWDLDPKLQSTDNVIRYSQENVTSSRPSSSSGRWEFFTTERRLFLTPGDDDHGAIIHCYGDHPGLRERLLASITLSVLVSPSYIRIFDDRSQLLSDMGSVNVTQDSAVTFLCICTRSRPPTFPKWRIGNDLIEDNVTRNIIQYDGNLELSDVWSYMTLQRVLRQHHGKEVTCSASGLNLRSVATNITLHVLGFPDPPRITNPAETIIERRAQSLECTALNGFPPGEIEWLIDGDPAPDTNNTIVKRWRYDVTSRITINPDRDMNGKEATCIVSSPTLSDRKMRTSVALNVKFCPLRVSISCEPLLAGKPGIVTCTSGLGNPAPRLKWTVDGQEIDSMNVEHVESSNSSNITEGFISSSVYSRSFVADDHGKIVRCCAARNETMGCTAECAECPLIVYCKPKLLQKRNDMIMAIREYYITLRCSARGNPTPSIEWYSPWIHDSPINGSTPGVISLVNTIIDRVTIQSTLVIESSAGADTSVQGIKCVASNSVGSSSTASFFGNTSDISSVYDRETGLLTVRYSPDSVPFSTEDLPCVHVDQKLANKQVWKLGSTCFKLESNETVIQVMAGLDSTEIRLRVCYYEEFCDSPLPPQPSAQTSPIVMNNILIPTLAVVAILVILCISAGLFIYHKKSRKVHEENRYDRNDSRRNQVSFVRTDQRPQARAEDAAPAGQSTRGEMNYYMDMASSGTRRGAITSRTFLTGPFHDGSDLLAYEDMRVAEQPSSPGYAHYEAGSQAVDCLVYANMTPSTPLKRSDSGICSCTYSISPSQIDSPHLQTNSTPNTYESSIFTAPLKLQMPPKGAADQGDAYTPMTPEGYFAGPSSPSTATVASEWSFFPMGATSTSSPREKNDMPLYATVPKEVD